MRADLPYRTLWSTRGRMSTFIYVIFRTPGARSSGRGRHGDVTGDDDPLIVWARQGDKPGVRVFRNADAIAVACPDVCRKDRVVVHGTADNVVPFADDPAEGVAALLGQVESSYRPMGDEKLIDELAAICDRVEVAGRFGWMETSSPVRGSPTRTRAGAWLDRDDEVAELLRRAFPESYAWPGGTGVRRWAGIRQSGRLLATAAEAWTVPGIGFLAGVTTHPAARRRGLAAALCGFVTDELLREHARVALFVDYWNSAALRTYQRLGYTLRPVAAARLHC